MNAPQVVPLIIKIRRELHESVKMEARLKNIHTDEVIDHALVAYFGLDKPVPNPTPFTITVLKEPT